MSSAGINGGGIGKAVIENWLSDHRLPFRPFLRGNLEKALRYHKNLKMGSSSSSLKPVTPPQEGEREILASDEEDEEDEDPRPAKRRKTTNIDPTTVLADVSSSRSRSSSSNLTSTTVPSSLIHSTSEESQLPTPARLPSRSQVNKIKPTDFYGHQPSTSLGSKTNLSITKSRPGRIGIDSVLKATEPPVDFQKLLRIKVASIIQNSSHEETEDQVTSQYSNIKCTLALFRILKDEPLIDIYRQPQTGRIRRTPEGSQNDSFSIYLPPFIIPSDVLSQDPNFDDSSNQLQGPIELGKYQVQLLIEPYRANVKRWLPLTTSSILDSSLLARRISKGQAEFTDVRQIICEFLLFDWNVKHSTAQIDLIYEGDRVETAASLKLDIQWSLPSRLHKKEEYVELPKLPTPVPKLAPELIMPHILSPQKAAAIEPESPSRHQRRGRGNVQTYNLKALSAKAQGKKLRAHWSKENSGTFSAAPDTGENLTYTFSKANAEAYGIKQTHVVAGFSCPICNLDTKYMDSLRLHFKNTHNRFIFHARPKSSFFVEINRETRRSMEDHPLQTIQIGRATTLLDMEKYLSGDSSWTEAREGPRNDQWPNLDNLAHLGFEASPSTSPRNSRQSSPEVSGSDTGSKESEGLVPVPAKIRRLATVPVRNKKKHYVPGTHNRPYSKSAYAPDIADRVFYDLRTKRELKPGEELPDSDDEKDEAWLLHKRKDIINEYSDLTDIEKEYLIKWEEFIMGERLTNLSHLPVTIERFVARNRVWFAEKEARKAEWHKQIEVFIARDGLESQPLMSHCDKIFNQGTKELDAKLKSESEFALRPEVDAKPELEPEPEMRGGTDCVCGDLVQSPDQVICSGKVSLYIIYSFYMY